MLVLAAIAISIEEIIAFTKVIDRCRIEHALHIVFVGQIVLVISFSKNIV